MIKTVPFDSGGLMLYRNEIPSNEIPSAENEISLTEIEIPQTETKYIRLTTKSVSF
jgi:hypothetical protein